MKQYTVAVLGATGAVGQEMMKILAERDFPVGTLVPLASARSAGKTVKFKGQDVTIREAADDAFAGVDIVLARPKMTSPSASLPPSSARARCSWIIPPPSGFRTACPWWCRRSIPRT